MVEKRKRGIELDKTKVLIRATLMKMPSLASFEIGYMRYFKIDEGRNVTAPKKAWKGMVMDKSYAIKIAQLLALPDYLSLLPDPLSSPWSYLIQNEKYHAAFMHFQPISESDHKLIDMDVFHQASYKGLAAIHIKEQWHLLFSGKPNDTYMAVLQSENDIFQLAPIEGDAFMSMMPKGQVKLRYPSKIGFSFGKKEQYGLGWRRCIAIRSSSLIPLPPKSQNTGYLLSARDLDEFALRLMQDKNLKVAIDQYEFMLVDD